MKQGFTELVFILDRSGSMGGLETDTIGGFNTMLKKQKAIDGDCLLTTVLFDNTYELLHDRIDIRAVGEITEKEYFVGGSTALLDAIGRTIQKIGNAQKRTAEEYRASKVMMVIITDGHENASREYSSQKVKAMIERKKDRYGWEFVFLGANIDAVETAARYGIHRDRAQTYRADTQGVELNFCVLNNMVSSVREGVQISDEWYAQIEDDFRARGGESSEEQPPPTF